MGRSAGTPEPDGGRRHILLVEDDEASAEAIGRMLQHAGFDVTRAADFRVALEVLEREQPIDLLLTDIVMPAGINGMALSRMARMRRRDLKVLYMTGYSVPGAEREALGPILRKPVDSALLIQEIEQLLGSAGPAPRNSATQDSAG